MVDHRAARWHIYIQKIQFGYILECLGMENVGIFWRALEWKMLVYIWEGLGLENVGIFFSNLVLFVALW
jgi:hypothetical protein